MYKRQVVNIGYDYESSLKAVELSKKEDFFYASVGLHPHDSKDYNKILENEFIKLVKENEKVVAYGCLLYTSDNKHGSTVNISLNVHNTKELEDLFRKIKNVQGVKDVYRV